MENLYAAAGQATGEAVSGWENFWKEMCETLQRAYRINICMQELNEQIAQLEQDCPEFCREALTELEDDSRRAAAELARLKEERHNRWLADSAAFHNDLDNAIAEFTNNLGRSDICCQDGRSGNVVYTFPPYGAVPLRSRSVILMTFITSPSSGRRWCRACGCRSPTRCRTRTGPSPACRR